MEAYPLSWPMGYVRNESPRKSRFKATLAKARDYVKREVGNIDGSELIISTNLPVNRNGELRADFERFKISDTGVAIYFTRNEKPASLCCDEFDQVRDNLHAIGRTLEGLRQIHRDGVSDFLNRAFSGFTALPAPGDTSVNIWPVLEFTKPPDTIQEVEAAYKRLLRQRHPDQPGGSDEAFIQLQEAYKKALSYFS